MSEITKNDLRAAIEDKLCAYFGVSGAQATDTQIFQSSAMILKVLDGTAPADIPYETLSNYAQYVNLQAAGKLNLTLTDEMLQNFDVLVEADGTSHFGQ